MNTRKPKLHPLSLSLHLALALTLPATAAAQQLIVDDGSTQTASGTYDTGGDYDTTVIGAIGAGSTILGDGVTAMTAGQWARALFVDEGGRMMSEGG